MKRSTVSSDIAEPIFLRKLGDSAIMGLCDCPFSWVISPEFPVLVKTPEKPTSGFLFFISLKLSKFTLVCNCLLTGVTSLRVVLFNSMILHSSCNEQMSTVVKISPLCQIPNKGIVDDKIVQIDD